MKAYRARLCRTAGFLFALAFAFVVSPRTAADSPEHRLLRQAPVIAGSAITDPAVRLQLASTSNDYPVTPGDIYRLTYLRAGEPTVTEVIVENDYRVNLTLFGRVDATGLSFIALKQRIQQIVEAAIPRSVPSVTIVSAGIFQVRITGQIEQSRSISAWGMTRLSDAVREQLTPYSSIRSIAVVNAAGRRSEYDLFRAIELGDLSQDPYLRPGDSVIVSRAVRVIYIGGEVNRNGRYELTENDSVPEVLEYARGATRVADLTRVRIRRTVDRTVRTYTRDFSPDSARFAFLDGDIVSVPSRVLSQPIVYVEGPLHYAPEGAPAEEVRETRLVIPFDHGDTLYTVLVRLREQVSPLADLTPAKLMRDGRQVRLRADLERLLYDYSPENDIEIRPFDRIVLPPRPDPSEPAPSARPPEPVFDISEEEWDEPVPSWEPMPLDPVPLPPLRVAPRPEPLPEPEPEPEPFVLITGAVNRAGHYPVLRGADARAHIRQAGGINRELNTNGDYRIFDAKGNPKPLNAPVEDGDHIEVLRNSFVYNFNRYFPIVVTGVGFLATIVATLSLFAL